MSSSTTSARRALMEEVAVALAEGASSTAIVDLLIRTGWQPGPDRAPDSDHVDGLLDSGRVVPIEIRRARHNYPG